MTNIGNNLKVSTNTQGKANLLKDKLILERVKEGYLKVYKNGRVIGHRGNFLQGYTDEDGYNRITIRVNKIKYSIRRHRLVWIVFNGLIEDPTLVVNHRNGKKSCNSLRNLELATESENLQHAWNKELRK